MTLVEKSVQPFEASAYLRLVGRFPVTLACVVLFASVIFAETHGLFRDISFLKENREAWLGATSLVFLLIPASLAATLFSEARAWPTERRLLLTGLAVVFCVLVVAANGSGSKVQDIIFGAFGMLILAILSPSLRPGLSNQAFWSVIRKILTSITFGLLVAVIIGFAVGLGLELINELFGVRAPRVISKDVWIFSLVLIWPFLALLRMPDLSSTPEAADAPGWLLFTFNRLLAPLALITAALFLAFAAMTAIQWELPSHNSSARVIVIAGLGVLVWLTFFPFRDEGSRALRLYQRTYPFALLVLAALPAAAAAARIAGQVVTEQLYWELLLSVTIGGIAVYLLAVRPPRLIVPPLAFALVMIAGSFGPWGAAAVSMGSRIGEFEALLEENGRLVDGRIVPKGEMTDTIIGINLKSMIWSIRRHGGSEALTEWLAEAGITIDGETEPIEVLERMGIEYVAEWKAGGVFQFMVKAEDPDRGTLNQLFDVAGYDVIAPLFVDDTARTVEISAGVTHQTYIVTIADYTLHIARVEDSANGVKLNFRRIVESLWDIQTGVSTVVTPDQLTIEAQNNGLRARFIASYLDGIRTDGVIQGLGGPGLLLVGRAE